MSFLNKNQLSKLTVILIFLATLLLAVACTTTGGAEPDAENSDETIEEMDSEDMEEMDHDEEDMDHDEEDMEDMEHDDEHDHDEMEHTRIPNEGGASIHIVTPANGATLAADEQLIVEVEMENFNYGDDGNHWHIYIDGSSWGMVTGHNTDQALSGLEPGEHEIAVFMSIETHE
jgi:uncharacterized protein involved in copper resistance